MEKTFEILKFFDIHDFYESNKLIVSTCPIHEGDNTTAFNLNIDVNSAFYGRWFCNTHCCHKNKSRNDIISLTHLLLDKKFNKKHSFSEVLTFCNNITNDVHIDINLPNDVDPLHNFFFQQYETNVKKHESKITKNVVRERLTFPAQYYINRGFLSETLNEFDIGLCTRYGSQMYNRIVFPVYDADDKYMIGCVGRTICNHPSKWINQKGFNKSNYLYNFGKALEHIKRTESIILVEGQGDVLRLYEAGIKNAVGIFGSSLSDTQEFMIQQTGASNIIILTDNDQSGISCANEIESKLKFLFNIERIMPIKKDVGEMTTDEITIHIKPKIKNKF